MDITDGLYNKFKDRIEAASPHLFASEQMKTVLEDFRTWTPESAKSIQLARVGHVVMALRRRLNETGTSLTFGKTFYTKPYATFQDGEHEAEYECRLLIITDIENEGTITKTMDRLFEGTAPKAGSLVVAQMVTPSDIGGILSIDGITFAVVQTGSGENFTFEITTNSKKGKVIATEGMQSEFGDIREHFGVIDKCSLEAVETTPHTKALILEELKKAKEALNVKNITKKKRGEDLTENVKHMGRKALKHVNQKLPRLRHN